MFSPADVVPEEVTILAVGNLIPSKGHELLLRSFAAIKNRFPALSHKIIGNGPEQSRLERIAGELRIGGSVRFLGRQSRAQVADAMRSASVFALPSKYEGLGCVYLEAMSASLPVVACRGQGIEEIIQSGMNGCLVEPDNLLELTETLFGLLQQDELRRKMGVAARHTIVQEYTQAEQAARLFRLYQECLG